MNSERTGEDFREDLRPRSAGSGNAAARRVLGADELSALTRLDDLRSLGAVAQTAAIIVLALGFGLWAWPSPWVLASVLVIGVEQHGLFILAHEAAHYRLFGRRAVNDAVGRIIAMTGAVSMCTYRVIHRLHHNNLYSDEDPDTAIHGGYPRGVAYLWRKLAQDLAGLNAWKTIAYFFGAPALNDETNRSARPLDDTSPQLRAAARADRWLVVAFHLLAPLVALVIAGWRGLALYAVFWVVPLLTVLQPILRLRAICEHGGVTDFSSPLTAARTNRTWGRFGNLLGRVLLFPHHVNYHLEHHLYPAVPHYHLPRLHRMLAAKDALDGAEVRDIGETFGLVFAPRQARITAAQSP
jgi:fatty acid desaturase